MGYETKIFVVERMPYSPGKLVRIDDDEVHHLYADKDEYKAPYTDCYYYAEDGNTKVFLAKDLNYQVIDCKWWYSVIGMLEMSKMGGLSFGSTCTFEKSDGGFMYCASNGNKYVGLDPYGSYRKFVPIDNCIKILEETNDDYRRFKVLKTFLKSIKQNFHQNNIGILEYGH